MGVFKNLKIQAQILLTVIVLIVALVSVGVFGLYQLAQINDSQQQMYDKSLLPMTHLSDAQYAFMSYRIQVYVHITTTDPSQFPAIEQKMTQYEADLWKEMAEYEPTLLTEEGRKVFAQMRPAWNEYRQVVDRVVAESRKDTPQSRQKALEIALTEAPAKVKAVEDILNTMIDQKRALAEQDVKAGMDRYESDRTLTIVILALITAAAGATGYLTARAIARPLQKVELVAAAVAAGDLSVDAEEMQGRNEVASLSRSVHAMVGSLRSLIRQVADGAAQVAAASQQISASTEQLAGGSQSQAQEAQKLTTVIKQMADAVEQVAASAQNASMNSEKVTRATEMGQVVIDKAVGGMETVNQKVAALGKSSEQIGEIIEVIDDIAGQTNLLALNAAIEAARAGEHGKGFAVVAEEVRKLAERSSQATKEIAALIKSIQKGTDEAVDAVSNGTEMAGEAGKAFKEIAQLVRDTGAQIAEIAAAAEEQAASADNSVTSVQTIAAITEEASAASQETASSAQSLASMATELQQAVEKFKL